MNGDDKKEFLDGNIVDILYWWIEMDNISLIYLFVGKLNFNNSTSSNHTHASTTRDLNSSLLSSNKKAKTLNDMKEMVDNVASVASMQPSVQIKLNGKRFC